MSIYFLISHVFSMLQIMNLLFTCSCLITFDKIWQCLKCLSGCNVISSIVIKRFNFVMFDVVGSLCLIVLDRECKSSRILFRFTYKESSSGIYVSHQVFLSGPPADFTKIPFLWLQRWQKCNIIPWNVSCFTSILVSGHPPIRICIINNLHVIPFVEWHVSEFRSLLLEMQKGVSRSSISQSKCGV